MPPKNDPKKQPPSKSRPRVPPHRVAAETTDLTPGKGTVRRRSRFQYTTESTNRGPFDTGAAQAAIDATAEGESASTACIIAGITIHALQKWISLARAGSPTHMRFFKELSIARRKAESRRRKIVDAAAMGAKIPSTTRRMVEVEGVMVEKLVTIEMVPDAKAAQWLLEKLSRKRFGKVERIEHTGRDGAPLRAAPLVVMFQGWSDEQIEQYAKTGKKPEGAGEKKEDEIITSVEDQLDGMLDAGFDEE